MADMEELAKVSAAMADSPLPKCHDLIALHDQKCSPPSTQVWSRE